MHTAFMNTATTREDTTMSDTGPHPDYPTYGAMRDLASIEQFGQHDAEPASVEWRIFDADAEETTEEPVGESAARKEFERTVALNPASRFELHHRVTGGEWEVVC